ncbi:MAG: isoleucine--tRNA ligase [Nanoarchaeota archaeon]
MLDLKQREKEILDFWEKNKIFEKLRKKNKGKTRWSFLDGPITANNPMGVHHAWGRTYKDLFQRFKAMQGFDQRYQNGFDCQGLWVEREEEKDLGLKNKSDIEKFGILNFVNSCRKRVEKFSKIQTQQSIRLGFWMDWNNSYYTMSNENNLHNWFLIKKYHENGWLYKGKDSVPWCWRCGTASSKHDIATEGYKEVTHTSLFMQFPLKKNPDEYFLIFTTTPWTVPANVAIAVNPNINYVKVDNEGVFYWLAESRTSELEGKWKIVERKKGAELNGIEYLMPYYNFESQKNSPHKVVLWDLASEEEGTGIVHIAPGCGAEDFDLGKKLKLPAVSPLNEAGFYIEGFEQFSLKKYDIVNKDVLNDLEQRRFVYKTKPYKHRYPHCWRCGNELVFRLVSEWYISSKEIREKLIKVNKKVNWYPEYGKIRQEEWFNNMGDWLISRKRYWGLPLPIWECECGEIIVIGSLEELKEKSIDKKKVDLLKDIHRPWIDEIKIRCGKCKKDASRIPDVGDAWLDAGIVPFSTIGPYLYNKKEWEKWFPVDLITESIPGQFRGWFNSLFWASVAITGKSPFKSLFGYETLRDEKGEEMHKSKGNAIWFDEAVEKAGADALRLRYCIQDPSQELRFGFNVLKESSTNLLILYNIRNLITSAKEVKILKLEDKWILSKINNLTKKVTNELENLHPHTAARALQNFWINDLSRGYIQLIRDRISSEDQESQYTLKEVFLKLIKLCAPFFPFITENIWQSWKEKNIVLEESVHLSDWPEVEKKTINEKLENNFEYIFKIIEIGLSERDKLKIGLRWPLASADIISQNKISKKFQEIIKRQLNVKKIFIKEGKEVKVILDTKTTFELEAEGYARELARKLQAERKNAGLIKNDAIILKIFADKEIIKMLKIHERFLKDRTNSKKIEFIEGENTKEAIVFTIREKKIHFFFRNY